MVEQLDIKANRRSKKWTPKENACRVLWCFIHPLFYMSPRPLWGWRRFLLRVFGSHIGHQVNVFPSAKITIPWNLDIGDYSAIGDGVRLYALGRVTIGARVTVSQGVHLCAGTHDYRDASMPLVKSTIEIGDETWICADAFIGPGVVVGPRAIVGARAVVVKDVVPSSIVVGNPVRIVGTR